jgi:hypothetical protein
MTFQNADVMNSQRMFLASYFDVKPLQEEVGSCPHVATQCYGETERPNINALCLRFASSEVIDRLCFQDVEVSTKLSDGSV